MKILVLGAGALGGYYGARLIEAGADVTFLVRPAREQRLAEQGLVVRSSLGDFSRKVKTIVSAKDSETYDAILFTCKAYDLASAVEAIAPAAGSDTCIVPLLNGMAVYDVLDTRFGADRVLGGISYIATTLTPAGEIAHLSPMDTLIVGARRPGQESRARAFFEYASKSAGTRVLSGQIEQALWEKWVMICAGAASTCLMRATIGEILQTASGSDVIRGILAECEAVARAAGHEPGAEAKQSMGAALLDPASNWAASMMRDIDAKASRIEADAVVGDMIRRGHQAGLHTPLLEVAYAHLQAYEVSQRRRQ